MSGEAVPYHLRQNKHVDRQLFMELLAHLNRFLPVRNAFYVSFGGVYFEDFKLIHSIFGTESMLSIEEQTWLVDRQKHNKPFGCIECVEMKSRKLVNEIDQIRETRPDKPLICWLDFAAANKRRSQLEEVSTLIKSCRENDVIRITLNANADTLGGQREGELADDRDLRRLLALRDELGDKVPGEAEVKDITRDGFPLTLVKILHLEVARAMKSQPDLEFQPLGCYSYNDSNHVMLTVTGILLRSGSIPNFMDITGLEDCRFASLRWQLRHINVPLLSQREKLALDQRFGMESPEEVAESLGFQLDKKRDTSTKMLRDYFDYHRFYPYFHRIQY